MPLTHEAILKRVSEALTHADAADSWVSQLQEEGIVWDGATDAYYCSLILNDLERDLTSEILAEDLAKKGGA